MRGNGRCGLRGGDYGFRGCCGKDSGVVNTTSGRRLMYNSIVMIPKPRVFAVFIKSTYLKTCIPLFCLHPSSFPLGHHSQ